MGAGTRIKAILALRNMMIKDLAKDLEIENPQVLINKLNRDKMSFTEAERMFDALNCDVVVRDRETGKEY